MIRRRGIREIGSRLPLRPGLTFLWMYVLRLGFLDVGELRLYLLHPIHHWHVNLGTADWLTPGPLAS